MCYGGSPKQFEHHCRYLASRGMVAMAADYRVRSRNGTSPRECVQDGKSAIRWIRTHAARLGIDPDRIAAGGGSAGGHVAAATGMVDGLNEPGEDASVIRPSNALEDPDPGNNANFKAERYTLHRYVDGHFGWYTEVGAFENSSSPYGTFDQGGNAWEWNETLISAAYPPGLYRGVRGDYFGSYWQSYLNSGYRYWESPTRLNGFRVAFVPEPGSVALLLSAALALAAYARCRLTRES